MTDDVLYSLVGVVLGFTLSTIAFQVGVWLERRNRRR